MSGLTPAGAAIDAALFSQLAPATRHAVVGVAVSGGADSLALLLIAAAWRSQLPAAPRLIVYSVDHALRPEASDEVAFVLREAARLGLEARGLRWERRPGDPRSQAAAREARYRLIGQAMRAGGATLLLTAHHLDDQAETVLMRLAHGSGLGGLRGMDVMTDVGGIPVLRPLLGIPRERLRRIVLAAGLVPAADPSNVDPHYARARLRALMPALAGEGLDTPALARFARRAGEADAALVQWAESVRRDAARIDAFGAVSIETSVLAALPRAVGVRLLARLIDIAGGSRRGSALGAVEAVFDSVCDPGPFAARTLLGASLRRRGDTLWLSREAGRSPLPEVELAGHRDLLWDDRFIVTNGSGRPVSVGMAGGLSRATAERLLGAAVLAPAAAIRSAPLVRDAHGGLLALGTYCLDRLITVNPVVR